MPSIRFPEFSGTWELRNLGELTERVRSNDGRMNLPTLTISAAKGWLDQRERFSANIAGNEQKNYTLLSKGELSYNKGNSKLAKYGVVFELKNYKEALVPRVYHSFRVNKYSLASFIEYMFETKKTDQELAKIISSGARMDGLLNIGYEDFMGIKVKVPNILEQEKISNLISSFDANVFLQQQKLAILQQTKQGFLQKMFLKEGESIPEVRFPGFTDAWEQRKLGEMGEFRKRYSYSRVDEGKGEYAHIHYGDIHSKYTGFINSTTNVPTIKSILEHETLLNGDIIIADASEDHDDLGKTLIIEDINNRKLIAGSHTFNFRPVETLNSSFYLYYTQSDSYKNFIYKKATGISVLGLSKNNIGNMMFKIPSNLEQTKIGAFFKQLDNAITLQQCELDALKETKKAFLQKMFV